MYRHTLLSALSLLLALAPPVRAQEQRLADLEKKGSQLPEGSAAWFAHNFERVDARLAFDSRSAWTELEPLLQRAARDDAPRGAESAAKALAAFVKSRIEGTLVAREWLARSETIADDADDSMRVHYLLARARCLCAIGEHAKEFEVAIPGQKLAEKLGEPVLVVRAMLTTMHTTPQRGLASINKIIAEIQKAGRGAEIEFLRAWGSSQKSPVRNSVRHKEAGLKLLDELYVLAKKQGNLRIRSFVAATRANVLCMDRDLEGAIANYTESMECNDRLGDPDERAACRDMLAWAAVQKQEYDEAERWLQEADAIVSGRGLDHVERALLQTRLTLAVHRRDGDAAAALAQELEERAAAMRQHEQRIAEVRASLEQAEVERDAAEAELLREHQAVELGARETRLQLAAMAFAALALLTVTTLRSRRRLQRTNAELARQVQRVEDGRATQAKLEDRIR
ncbi:MAG: hypothetical protein ABL997_20135, partial [Planctomycetota bacterium]